MSEPKIRYDILANAEGGAAVERLAASLEKLDQAIDPVAAERAQQLSNELRELGQQQAAIARFRELDAATADAKTQLAAAQAAAQAFRTELASGGDATAAQAGRLEKLEAAVRNAKTELQGQTAALDASKGRLAALGIDSQAAATAEASLSVATRATRSELQALGTSLQGVKAGELVDELRQLGQQQQGIQQLRDLGAATDKAGAGLASAEKAAEAYRQKLAGIEAPTAAQVNQQQRLGFAVDDARAKLVAQTQVFDAAKAKLAALGVETGDLATAEARLGTATDAALSKIRELGQQQQAVQRFSELAQATETARAKFAAADGAIDEFRGSLNTLAPPTRTEATELQRLGDAAAKAKVEFDQQKGGLDAARVGAERLGVSTRALDSVERDVRATLTGTRTELAALATESQRTAAAGERIAAAWQTLGVRSFRDVQTEAAKVRVALQQIQQTSRNPAEVKLATEAAQTKLQALNVELGGLERAAATSTAGAGAGFGALATKIAGAVSGVEALKRVVEVGLERQKLTAQLTSIFEDSQRVASEFGFIGDAAQQLGLRFDVAAGSYAKIAAAAKGTSLEGQKTRDIFTAVAQASTALKLSGDETQGTLLAISQIMSKGTVQSEELRGQLGERLPGAFQIAARAMGVTTAELGKLLESGSVAADVFLPKFAAELSKTFGPGSQQAARGLDAEFNRLINTLSTFGVEIANSGLFDSVTRQVRNLADALQRGLDSGELEQMAAKIGRSLTSLVEFLGKAAEWALKFGDALLFVAKVVAESALLAGIGKLLSGLGGVKVVAAEAAAGLTAVGAAAGASAGGIAAAGAGSAASAAKIGLLGAALKLLPASIAIAVAVEGLPVAGRAIGEFAAKLSGVDRDLAAAHQRRIEELGGEIAALAEGRAAQAQYASLVLLGRKQLLEQSTATREAYVQDVQGALAAAEAAEKYARRQAERAGQEKEQARLLGASTEALAAYGRQEREFGAEAEKAASRQAELRRALTAVDAAARDLATGLSPAAIALKETFDAVIRGGKDAAEVVKEIAKAADLTSVQGIQAFGQALRKLGEDGKLTPQQIEAAWKDAIDKLTGEDLQKFTTQARAAFGDTGRDAKAMADAIGAGVRQAFKGAGLDFEQFRSGISAGTRGAVADLDLIAQYAQKAGVSATQTGKALVDAFSKDIGAAKTAGDLELLNDRLTTYGKTGLLSADQTKLLRGEVDAARLGFGALGEAAKRAGIDIGELTTGVSATFRKEVDAVEALRVQLEQLGITADRSSPLLAKNLDQGIAAAKTKEEVALLRGETERLAASGKLLGSDYAEALEKIKAKAEEVSPAFRQLQRDAKALGVAIGAESQSGVNQAITSYERLKSSGRLTTDQLQTAFISYANTVIKANAGLVPDFLKVEAGLRGVSLQADSTGKTIAKAIDDSRPAVDRFGNALNQMAGSFGPVKQGASDTQLAFLQAKIAAGEYISESEAILLTNTHLVDSFNSLATAARNAQDFSILGKNTYDKQGFATDASGNRITAEQQVKVPDGGSFDKAAFDRAAQAAARSGQTPPDPNRYVRDAGGSYVRGAGGFAPKTGFGTITDPVALEFFNPDGTRKGASPAPTSPLSASTPSGTSTPTASPSSVKIDISLGGKTSTVAVASQTDADVMTDLFRRLEDAARSSGVTPGG